MSFQTPITIASAIANIESNKYLLPSIQREFEWSHEKIEWLFDSIMRNYPISSFLFWKVEGETKRDFKFYKFIREFKQKYKTHNEEFNTHGHNDFTAILDGQQRLTSLYIGLRGTYAYRLPRLHDENSERVYPTRKLFLNLSGPLDNEEDGRIYEFKFLTDVEYKSSQEKWFEVSIIFGLSDDFDFHEYLDAHNLKSDKFAFKTLSTLKNVIHSKQIINFFLETEQEIDKALNIFIRINSGGEPLSFSDLIMSIAVANWSKKDARKEIHDLTDSVRDKGFTITKDFVLRVFLFLHSKDIKFKVTNFSKTNAKDFENQWDRIRNTILSAFDLAKSYAFTDSTLTSKLALLPVIYYIYHREVEKKFVTGTEFKEDREIIRKWLLVSFVKKIFGGKSDNFLSQIRKSFTDDVEKNPVSNDLSSFPAEQINVQIRKDTIIDDNSIEDLLKTQYEDSYAFSILALLFPTLDYRNNNFHKDHLHPKTGYKKIDPSLKKVIDEKTFNSILNLQMLDANENMAKNACDLESWVSKETQSKPRSEFLKAHHLPDVSFKIENIDVFFSERKTILAAKLKEILT